MGRILLASAALLLCVGPVYGELDMQDDGKSLTVSENGKPILTYHYTRVDPPEGVPADRYWRMDYFHPVYGPDGDVLTQDFPDDHRHHRGIFWGWPEGKAGDRKMDTWAIVGVRQLFEKWLEREKTEHYVRVAVENMWKFDDDPNPVVRERLFFTVFPGDDMGRMVDFVLQFQNVAGEDVTFLGSQAGDKKAGKGRKKGYGGFCFRPDKSRVPLTFTAAMGQVKEDVLYLETPWADVVSRIKPDGPYSGLAIFQHPGNPGYPHPGWILRNYGFLGTSWPHNEPFVLKPGEHVELRYRVYIHRGTATEAKVAERFEEFVAAEKGK